VEPGREDNVFLKRKVIYGNKPSTLYLWWEAERNQLRNEN
jgi:hypothetical protein